MMSFALISVYVVAFCILSAYTAVICDMSVGNTSTTAIPILL